jgi:hypothetical protein
MEPMDQTGVKNRNPGTALPEPVARPILASDRPWRRVPPGVAARRWKQADRVPVVTL